MAHEQKLPEVGEGIAAGEVLRWLVSEGDTVEAGDPLVEVQTDKATVEVPCAVAGVVLMLLAAEGDLVPVGSTLAVIGAEGEHLLRPVDSPPRSEPPPIVAVVRPESLADARAAPDVRSLAQRLGVDLEQVAGTAPGGRITETDVREAAARRSSGERREPIRGIRRALVEHVQRTQREVPAVTFVEECDFTGVDDRRLVALVLHAVARSLAAHPALNARVEGDEIVYLDRHDLGVTVSTAAGTVVPVVRSCDTRSIEEIDAEVTRLVCSAQAGTLAPDELRDSTFTVAIAGALGGLLMTPLINHPEVAILGLHRVSPRPVVREGMVVIREVGNVSLTFDHRVVDGAQAAAFCLAVIERLQDHGGRPVQSR